MNRLTRNVGKALGVVAWPALFIYLHIGTRTRVLILAEGKVALVQGWLNNDDWELPGGGLHHHEAPLSGAIRETREETGIGLNPGDCTFLGTKTLRRRGLTATYHFFAAELANCPPVRPQRGEIVAVRWFAVSQLQSLRHKADVDTALRLLAEHG